MDCIDMERALQVILQMVGGGRCHLVATVNPEFVMRARRDTAFGQVLDSSDLCLADGWGVLWAARRRGCGLSDRVTGTDLVLRLASQGADAGLRIFLLGAAPGVAAETAARLTRANPGLVVAGTHDGSPAPSDDEQTLALVRAARPDILLVAYGAPRQELWIARLREQLPVSVAIGVGGAFDFIAGRVRRAPRWMQQAGLEWLFRLARQPWRIRRMSVLPVYALRVLREG